MLSYLLALNSTFSSPLLFQRFSVCCATHAYATAFTCAATASCAAVSACAVFSNSTFLLLLMVLIQLALLLLERLTASLA